MGDVPTAHVPSPFRPAPGWLRWVKRMLLVVGLLVAAWYVRKIIRGSAFNHVAWAIDNARKEGTVDGFLRAAQFETDPDSKAEIISALRPDLGKLHTAARKKLEHAGAPKPAGLDPLFAQLLASFGNVIAFVGPAATLDTASFDAVAASIASPTITVADVGKHAASKWPCQYGLRDAFKQVLGAELITFDRPDAGTAVSGIHIEATYAIHASGTTYQTEVGNRVFPGIRMTGELKLVDGTQTLATVSMDAEPPPSLTFSTDMYGGLTEGGNDESVGTALGEGACETVGYRLIEQLTGLKPPEPATNDQKEPTSEEELLAACRDHRVGSPAACGAYADLLVAQASEAGQGSAAVTKDAQLELASKARIYFMKGCDAHDGYSCMRRGWVDTHRPDGSAPSPHAYLEAFDSYVRACDLGNAEGCALASDSLRDPEVLGPKPRTVRGVALGKDTIFDVTWQDWIDYDQGHAALWVASKQSEDEVRGRLGVLVGTNNARVFPLAELPFGIAPPAGTATVWAVYPNPAGSSGLGNQMPCKPCNGEPMPRFYVGGCTCLPLKSVKTRVPIELP